MTCWLCKKPPALRISRVKHGKLTLDYFYTCQKCAPFAFTIEAQAQRKTEEREQKLGRMLAQSKRSWGA